MDSFWSLMDVIFVGAGLYMFYSLYMMKAKGEIKTALLLNKDVNLKKCKDLEGYKNFMMPKMAIFGIGAIVYGAAGLINSYAVPLGIAYTVIMIAFFAVLVWFALMGRKAVQRFW